MDPFGNLVTVNTILADLDPRKRQLIILRESAIATGILLLAAVAGGALLGALGLKGHSLSISGGIVLFLIAHETGHRAVLQHMLRMEGVTVTRYA